MSKNIFNEFQIKGLEKNPNVPNASERSISCSTEFKLKAVTEYKSGKASSQVFIEQGLNLEVIGKNRPKRFLKRWRDSYKRFG